MNTERIYNKIVRIKDTSEKVLKLFFVYNDKNIKKAALQNLTGENILKYFIDTLFNKINKDTKYKAIDTLDSVHEENAYFYFKNENLHEELKFMTRIFEDNNNMPDALDFEDINGLLFKIEDGEDTIVLYQHFYSMSFIKKNSFLSLFVNGSVFEQFDKPFLNISHRIDFIFDKDFFIILNFNILEQKYKYKEVIMQDAKAIIEKISALDIVDGLKKMKDALTPTNAKKIKNIDEKVLEIFKKDSAKVQKFVENHTVLKNLKFNKDNKIMLKSKNDVSLFIKLLCDDFLFSNLTEQNFDSNSKTKIK